MSLISIACDHTKRQDSITALFLSIGGCSGGCCFKKIETARLTIFLMPSCPRLHITFTSHTLDTPKGFLRPTGQSIIFQKYECNIDKSEI